ncbi:hypothetical protein BGZ59_008802 [Podila verticillata]|nr:hypothetical protein BGZ59_008802 [Podila verticillata]KFH64533.1 hypothetical protein MVEG_09266 [Podila verticillata NRRL 6337]
MKIAILALAFVSIALAAPAAPEASVADLLSVDSPVGDTPVADVPFVDVSFANAPVAEASVGDAPITDARAKFDGDSKCSISGFKPSFSKINECCLKNMGGSHFDKKKNALKCRLPIGREGPMRKCVKGLGFATVVNCDY